MKRIQQVLEIEKQAQELRASAEREAQRMPVTAEQEAQSLVEKARNDARAEARQIIENARAAGESAQVITETEEKNRQLDSIAGKNMDKAISFVMDRILGRG
jgi:cell division septum initiation protein DivIVA